MLQIKSVVFDKGDYAYTIEYFDGHAVRKIATNEEAKDSLKISVKALADSLKKYLNIADLFNVKINSVRFGRNEDSAAAVQMTVSYVEKLMGIITKVHPISKTENTPDEELVACNDGVSELRGEVEKYISGERAQLNLEFEEGPENA